MAELRVENLRFHGSESVFDSLSLVSQNVASENIQNIDKQLAKSDFGDSLQDVKVLRD